MGIDKIKINNSNPIQLISQDTGQEEKVAMSQKVVTNIIEDINYELIGLSREDFSLVMSIGNLLRKFIYYDFKLGDKIKVILKNFQLIGSGLGYNFAILNDLGNYLLVAEEDGTYEFVLTKDTTWLQAALGNVGYTDILVDVTLFYGINDNCIVNRLDVLENITGDIVKTNVVNIEYDASELNRWLYVQHVYDYAYYGVRTSVSEDCYVDSIGINLFSDNVSYTGDSCFIYDAYIDLRNWFFYKNKYSAKIIRNGDDILKGKNNYHIVPDESAFISKGDYVFVGILCKDSLLALVSGVDNSDTNPVLTYIWSDEGGTANYAHYKPFRYIVNTYTLDNSLLLDMVSTNLDIVKNDVLAVSEQVDIKQNRIIIDNATNIPYSLIVVNGQLRLKSLVYQNCLYIGNSFTTGAFTGQAKDNRAMAASTYDLSYWKLIEDEYNIIAYLGKSIATFETNFKTLDPAYLELTDDYDAVVVQGGENLVPTTTEEVTEAFIRLYSYVKSACPSADIYALIAGNGQMASITISSNIAAANSCGIPYIQCNGGTLGSYADRFSLGDYIRTANGDYSELTNDGITNGHPSDVGMYNIANALLNAFGKDTINNRKFDITIVQTIGGTITTVAPYWISKGIVNIRCYADSGKQISSMNVLKESGGSVESTKRINSYGVYYTFVMPAENVTITPSWS